MKISKNKYLKNKYLKKKEGLIDTCHFHSVLLTGSCEFWEFNGVWSLYVFAL